MEDTPRALVVDDDETVRYTVRSILEHLGIDVKEATDGADGLARLEMKEPFHLVVTDLQMPRLDGLELLRKIGERPEPRPKVIMMTGFGSERQAVQAMQLGAFDYFKKPINVDDMTAVVRRAKESVRLVATVERLECERTLSRSLLFESQAMSRLAVLVRRVGPRDVTVLLNGESGTGKERVAEALVTCSARANKPFLRFNCAALTTELAEAELFGHSKGAFTGAVKSRLGLFREAHGGTLLLDEIGELPPGLQAKLLRVLQEGEVRPIGEDQPVKVDVRIIAATHRDLLQMSADGRFREDLYYRLKVVHLTVPPLRERPEDITVLAEHFLRESSRRFAAGPFRLTPPLLERLQGYAWPGNVRELQNAIESLVALAAGSELDLSLLPSPSPSTAPRPTQAAAAPVPVREPVADPSHAESAEPSLPGVRDLKARVDAYERGLLVSALEETSGNRSKAARMLGINRATLHGKLRKFGLATADTELEIA